MQRIAINGRAGSGKSTLARRLSRLLDLPYVEIDSLQHGAGWTRRPTFVDDVRRIIEGERWVIEFQYDDTQRSGLDVVRLRSPREVRSWLGGLSGSDGRPAPPR